MNYFKMFSNCILAKGHNRSVISDLQRQVSETIPNDLYEIIESLNAKKSISEIYEEYGIENQEIIAEYLEFLTEKEFGFPCTEEEYDWFPALNKTFNYPSEISNTIIELKPENINTLDFLIRQLSDLQCENIVLVFYERISEQEFSTIAASLQTYPIRSLEVVCPYSVMVDQLFLKNLNTVIPLTRITFFGADHDMVNYWDEEVFFDRVYTTKKITSFKYCGVVDSRYFNTNLPKVLEAVNHNSCLHKKIAIDAEGHIKNCPAMPQSFGNIKDTSLKDALQRKDFKQYWDLTKDHMDTCKDCEFRYICTDCRAYTERTQTNHRGLDISKPLKCGYNPYTGEWEEWSTNPLKQEAIRFYQMQNLV
ncbi:MAG: grasp-with-spasm system SPASM domain peptide maturase [Chryseobacterium sp.]|uniref:grasp-with-spasm system SPASM domain peptide maturase n=1 Tax=Chryseobacterium sp. TaxID=1871047 RepID=UPI0025C11375|nr:grasp-with-spasm system SPASM domain peptide maturase [Chryseobacterium sp.]MCJ7934787.1 grasp-with-spasm system SPASM domain peptide maturase [Chryseobacterium sp.]